MIKSNYVVTMTNQKLELSCFTCRVQWG